MPIYIHERDDWPAYSYDPHALVNGLEMASAARGKLSGILASIDFDAQQTQGVEALSVELVKSSAIEGERLDLETVRHSVANRLGLPRGGLATRDRYVDGLVEMAVDATLNYDQPLTAERIFNWHAALFPSGRGVFGPVVLGDWRRDQDGPMVVASHHRGREIIHFQAPDAHRLPHEMSTFLSWVESENEPSGILKAGIAHIWFETIHPLDDGNGRIGRNIMDLLLSRADQSRQRPYSLANQIHAERDKYYAVLEKTQKGNLDFTDWLIWYLEALTKTLDAATSSVTHALDRTRFWHAIREIPLNERQRKAVSRLLLGWEGRMTNKKYAKLCDCSDATATRDLTDLVAKGIVRTDGAGGRSTGYELVPRS